MPCDWVSVDVIDVSGAVQLGVDHDVYRQRLDRSGRLLGGGSKAAVSAHHGPAPTHLADGTDVDYCGPCYGAQEREGQCCNTCEDGARWWAR